ncbi:hypothetical protein ACWXVP_01345 [Mycoplasma sp. 1781]
MIADIKNDEIDKDRYANQLNIEYEILKQNLKLANDLKDGAAESSINIEKRIKQNLEEIKQKKLDIAEFTNQKKLLENNLVELGNNRTSMRIKIGELSELVEKNKKLIDSYNKNISDYHETLDRIAEANGSDTGIGDGGVAAEDRIWEIIDRLQSEKSSIEKDYERAQKELAEWEEKKKKLEKEIVPVVKEYRDFDGKILQAEKRLLELTKEKDENIERKAQSEKKLKEADANVAIKEKQKNDKFELLQLARAEATEAKKRRKDAENNLRLTKEKWITKNQEIQDANNALNSSNDILAALEQSLRDVKKIVDEKQKEVAKNEKSKSNVEVQKQNSFMNNKRLMKALESINNDISLKTDVLNQKSNELSDLNKRRELLAANKNASVQKANKNNIELQKVQHELNSANHKVQSLFENVGQKTKEVERIIKKLQDIEKAINKTNNNNNNNLTNKKQKEYENAKQKNDAALLKLNNEKYKLKEAQNELEKIAIEINLKQQKLEKAKNKFNDIYSLNQEIIKTINDADLSIKNILSESDNIKKQILKNEKELKSDEENVSVKEKELQKTKKE